MIPYFRFVDGSEIALTQILRQVKIQQLHTQLSICSFILIFIQTQRYVLGLSLESFLQRTQPIFKVNFSYKTFDIFRYNFLSILLLFIFERGISSKVVIWISFKCSEKFCNRLFPNSFYILSFSTKIFVLVGANRKCTIR